MELTKIIATALLPRLQRARPENVVLGDKDHSRRMQGDFVVPDFMAPYNKRHHLPELCFCVKGKLLMRMGEFHYCLKPGDLSVIGRNVYHCESFVNLEQSYEVIWVTMMSVRELIIMHCRYRDKKHEQTGSLHVGISGEFIRRLDHLVEKRFVWDAVEKELHRLSAIIRDAIKKTPQVREVKDQAGRRYQHTQLEKALDYINRKCSEDIHLKNVAEYIGLSPIYLERVLRNDMGTTFLRHLTRCRLAKALSLCNTTPKTISEIAYECGFSDPYDFSRVFKKYFGLPPPPFQGQVFPLNKLPSSDTPLFQASKSLKS